MTSTFERLERARGLNAAVAYDRDVIAAQLDEIDPRGSLGGMSIGVKDNICTLEYPTTCGSRILAGYRSPYEATAVARLKASGAVVACKTNLDEFAMGSSTEHSAFGRCQHPTHPDRVPGGSSGGSAALVASGAVDTALGSETGGSVRQPAAFCGIVGYKPSYGRVSRFGLVAFGSSLDQIGVFGRTVADASDVVRVISGHDPLDSTSRNVGPIDAGLQRGSLDGITIGVPLECLPTDLDPDVLSGCRRAIDAMRDAGATVKDVSLPHANLAIAAYYVIAPAEASANLARYDGVRYGTRAAQAADVHAMYRRTRGEGFGSEVRRRIIVGTYVLSAGYYDAYYRRAQTVRGRIAADHARLFDQGVDLLFTPTTPGPAFGAGERVDDPVAMYLADQFVVSANLVGLPAISVPMGVAANGLPVGGQLIGARDRDETVLDAAAVVESVVDATEVVR